MNKLKKLIDSLEENYIVVVDNIVKSYADKKSVEVIAQEQSVSPYVISTILKHLQLKRPKNKRDICVKEHYAMLNEESLDEYTEELEEENQALFEKAQKLENTLSKTRIELNLQRKVKRDIVKADVLEDKLLKAFESSLKKPTCVKAQFTQPNTKYRDSDEGLCIVLSDQHIGEIVGKDVVQNEYNYKVALKRLDKFLEAILTFPKQSRKINVMQCGDMLKGLIHGGLYNTEGSFIESIATAVDYNVYLYQVLSEVYEEVNIYSITGNHDRVTEDPSNSNKSLDFTRLVDKMVAKQLKALGIKNVKLFVTDTPYQLINVNNSNLLMFHGDTVRKYNPADANQRSLLQDLCLGTFKQPYKHAVSGHTHSFSACHNQYGGMSIVNGTLVGSNAYGVSNGMRDIVPSQTIFYVDQEGELEFIQAVKLS